ncbi:cupin domain-containing protein [Patescibacteria group bacterium]|nr:cupin domain-containing protein [Patescibacteria group bacterium]
MKGFVGNIEEASLENTDFRRVLYTAKNCQLVVMSIPPGQDIGEEVHALDQFIKCEAGKGKSVIDGMEHEFGAGWAVVIPAGARHNIINMSESEALKLYTVYAPPNHKDGVVHKTKADAEADEGEHFDGVTTDS